MIIETQQLTKIYRRFEKEAGLWGSVKSLFQRQYVDKAAVSGFDLSIEEGEFVGLIGPNGAGKTSLIKMLTGIIAATSGSISVLGYVPNRLEHGLKQQYAVVMGQKSQLFFELTAADTFLLMKEMYGIPDQEYHRNLAYFTELFGLEPYLHVQVRTLSLGERMKMELVAALLHNPRVLFLDEPTIGLDVVAQKQIRRFLKEVNETRGTTIILTSHYMEDIKSLCKRCVVINGGMKLYDGDTHTLFEAYQTHKKITVAFEGEEEDGLQELSQANEGLEIMERHGDSVSFMVRKEQAQTILRELITLYSIRDITIEEEDIGNVVERIYHSKEAGDRSL